MFDKVELTAIPYYAWCHRGANEMTVWMPRNPEDIPPPPLAGTFKASASHCWQRDTVSALNDGMLPTSSGDQGIPRLTWWDHKGASEWVQYDFPNPMKVTAVEVYWFDDTGRGHCRAPESWRLLYRDGGEWKPVKNAGAYGVEKDRFNKIMFDAIHTDAVRLEVQLCPGFSGGVLEWRVNQ